jgi:hypothetical protein
MMLVCPFTHEANNGCCGDVSSRLGVANPQRLDNAIHIRCDKSSRCQVERDDDEGQDIMLRRIPACTCGGIDIQTDRGCGDTRRKLGEIDAARLEGINLLLCQRRACVWIGELVIDPILNEQISCDLAHHGSQRAAGGILAVRRNNGPAKVR